MNQRQTSYSRDTFLEKLFTRGQRGRPRRRRQAAARSATRPLGGRPPSLLRRLVRKKSPGRKATRHHSARPVKRHPPTSPLTRLPASSPWPRPSLRAWQLARWLWAPWPRQSGRPSARPRPMDGPSAAHSCTSSRGTITYTSGGCSAPAKHIREKNGGRAWFLGLAQCEAWSFFRFLTK